LYGWIDGVLSRLVPGYTYFKSIAGSLAEAESETLHPVLVQYDDQAQIGFEMERLASGLVAVFLPGSPDTRSGSLSIVEPGRVSPLDARFHETIRSLARFGRGSAQLLDGLDRRRAGAAAPPPGC